jgi:hypothetical protein
MKEAAYSFERPVSTYEIIQWHNSVYNLKRVTLSVTLNSQGEILRDIKGSIRLNKNIQPQVFGNKLSFPSLAAASCTIRFNIQRFYVLPTQCVYKLRTYLRPNSHYRPTKCSPTCIYNRDGECLLRGTNWAFK